MHRTLVQVKDAGNNDSADARRSKLLRKVRSPKLSHLVADQLRQQIGRGEIRLGDTLPPEAELLEQFGISRPTLREALRILESESLIQLGRGSRTGATVLGPSIEAIAQRSSLYLCVQGTTLAQLHQVRLLLEPPIAALLAGRAKRSYADVLQRSAAQQRQALESRDYAAVLTAIHEFHGLLVKFSENHALNLLAGTLHDIWARLYPQLIQASDRRSQRPLLIKRCELAVAAYERLAKLIDAGKAAQAERHWRAYMEEVGRYLSQSGMGELRIQLPFSS